MEEIFTGENKDSFEKYLVEVFPVFKQSVMSRYHVYDWFCSFEFPMQLGVVLNYLEQEHDFYVEVFKDHCKPNDFNVYMNNSFIILERDDIPHSREDGYVIGFKEFDKAFNEGSLDQFESKF